MATNKKCRETGKVIFASSIEARLVMLDIKWNYFFKRDETKQAAASSTGRDGLYSGVHITVHIAGATT